MSPVHAIGLIYLQRTVDQYRPRQAGFPRVGLDDRAALEGDDDDLDVEFLQLPLVPSQLRQVFSARQSGEVSVKYQQQPVSGAVRELVPAARDLGETEPDGGVFTFGFHVSAAAS